MVHFVVLLFLFKSGFFVMPVQVHILMCLMKAN